jgi:hypothetical protein
MLSMCKEYGTCLPAQKRGHDPNTPVRAIRRYDWWDQADYTESTLSELLEDPLIRRLMTSDGVDPGELRVLFADLSARLARDEALPGDLGQI